MCSKWEEFGLLYDSGELNELDNAEFETHLKSCKECETEHNAYLNDKNNLFTPQILGEVPSDSVSSEIKRVCISAEKQHTITPVFSLVAKKAAVSMLLLIIGFASVTYIRINNDQAQSIRARIVEKQDTIDAAQNATTALSDTDSALFDSLKKDPDVNFSKARGNMNLKGVIPVDLQK